MGSPTFINSSKLVCRDASFFNCKFHATSSSATKNNPNKTGSQELNLAVATINCESSYNKAATIADYILEHDLDICCLTETWLNSDDTVTICELFLNGYEIISVPPKDRQGGGVAVIIKQLLSIKLNCSKDTTFRSFEHLNSIVSHPKHSQPLNLTIVYRPPRSNKNTLPIVQQISAKFRRFVPLMIKT